MFLITSLFTNGAVRLRTQRDKSVEQSRTQYNTVEKCGTEQSYSQMAVCGYVRRVGHAESQSCVRAHHREDLLQELGERRPNVSPVRPSVL